jgi:hypothetical protein
MPKPIEVQVAAFDPALKPVMTVAWCYRHGSGHAGDVMTLSNELLYEAQCTNGANGNDVVADEFRSAWAAAVRSAIVPGAVTCPRTWPVAVLKPLT